MAKGNEIAAVSATKDDSYDSWRAKDDMRTLLEAGRIRKDPVRMKHAKRAAKEQVQEMQAMQSLAEGK